MGPLHIPTNRLFLLLLLRLPLLLLLQAMRDLSGRRQRDVNNEQRLKKYVEGAGERERLEQEKKEVRHCCFYYYFYYSYFLCRPS